MPSRGPIQQSILVGRIIGGTFGFVFFGIGVSVIVFLWGQSFDDFQSPPLFFRVAGSLIALVFVVVGGTMFVAALKTGMLGQPAPTTVDDAGSPPPPTPTTAGYTCPSCGGALGVKADVSPLGDAKCPFCGRWFNIHGKA